MSHTVPPHLRDAQASVSFPSSIRDEADEKHDDVNPSNSPKAKRRVNFSDQLETSNKENQSLLEKVLARSQVLPLRRENARLVKANNNLHLQIIKAAEQADEKERGWGVKFRKLQSSFADLKFINTQKTRQINSQELELSQLRLKMEAILENKMSFNKESYQATSRIQEGTALPDQKILQPPPPSVVELVGVSEMKIRLLQRRLNEYELKEKAWKEERVVYQQMTEKREEELERLSNQLDLERNWDRLQAADELEANQLTIRKLQNQIDFLNATRVELEEKVKNYEMKDSPDWFKRALNRKDTEIKVAQTEYDNSLQEIKKMKHIIKEHQNMLENAKDANKSKEKELKKMYSDKEDELELLREQYAECMLENEQQQSKLDLQERKLAQLQGRNYEPHELEDMLQERLKDKNKEIADVREQYNTLLLKTEKTEKDYTRLAAEFGEYKKSSNSDATRLRNELKRTMDSNAALVRRIDRSSTTSAETNSELSKLQDQLELVSGLKDKIEKEREHYHNEYMKMTEACADVKQQCAQLEANMKEADHKLNDARRDLAAVRKERQSLLQELGDQTVQTKQAEAALLQEQGEVARLNSLLSGMDLVHSQANEARDNANDISIQHGKLERELASANTSLRMLKAEKETLLSKAAELSEERNLLVAVVQKFDKQLLNIQENVRSLAEEKNTLQHQLDESLAEITLRDNALIASKEEGGRLSSVIRDLRDEQSSLNQRIRQLTNTGDEKLDLVRSEQAKNKELEKAHAVTKRTLATAQEDYRELEEECTTLREDKLSLERRCHKLQNDLEQMTNKKENCDTTIQELQNQQNELKSLCRQLDQTRDRSEQQLKDMLRDGDDRAKRIADLNQEKRDALKQAENARAELEHHTQILATLDEERTALRQQVKEKDAEIAGLKSSSNEARKGHEQLSTELLAARHNLELQGAQLNTKDQQIESLSVQINTLTTEYNRIFQEHKQKSDELKAVLIDLSNMIKENQFVNNELSQAQTSRDKSSQEAERLVTRVQHLEEVAKAKDRERDDLLSTYRAACNEIDRLKVAANDLDQERAHFRQQIRQVEGQNSKLTVQIQVLTEEKERLQIDLHSYETQHQQLSQNVSEMAARLDEKTSAQRALALDVDSARKVSETLENSREEYQRKNAELRTQIHNQVQEATALVLENNNLKEALGLERQRIVDLESLIATLRVDVHQARTGFEDQLIDRSNKLEELTARVSQLNTHNHSLTEQINTLHQYREEQAAEITRLMEKLAETVSSYKSASASNEDAKGIAELKKVISTQTTKIQELQQKVSDMFENVHDLENEKVKLSSIVYKYEAEIIKLERERDASASSPSSSSPSSSAGSSSTSSSSRYIRSTTTTTTTRTE